MVVPNQRKGHLKHHGKGARRSSGAAPTSTSPAPCPTAAPPWPAPGSRGSLRDTRRWASSAPADRTTASRGSEHPPGAGSRHPDLGCHRLQADFDSSVAFVHLLHGGVQELQLRRDLPLRLLLRLLQPLVHVLQSHISSATGLSWMICALNLLLSSYLAAPWPEPDPPRPSRGGVIWPSKTAAICAPDQGSCHAKLRASRPPRPLVGGIDARKALDLPLPGFPQPTYVAIVVPSRL